MVCIGCPLVFGVSECRLKVSVLRLPVGNGLECAVFGKLPRAAFGLGKQCGGFRVGLVMSARLTMLKLSGSSVYSSVSSPLKKRQPLSFSKRGFAVKEADVPVLFGDGVGGDAAVECRGKCLCKCVHCGNTLGNLRILPRFPRCRQTAAVCGTMCAVCSLKVFLYFWSMERIRLFLRKTVMKDDVLKRQAHTAIQKS